MKNGFLELHLQEILVSGAVQGKCLRKGVVIGPWLMSPEAENCLGDCKADLDWEMRLGREGLAILGCQD
jgi:hypothetical protein